MPYHFSRIGYLFGFTKVLLWHLCQYKKMRNPAEDRPPFNFGMNLAKPTFSYHVGKGARCVVK